PLCSGVHIQSLNHTSATFQTGSYKKEGGINVLSGPELDAANDYFDQLESYGAFVVRNGELESWLPELDVKGHGPKWLIPMFEKMGEDPNSPSYIQPTESDVWEFVDKIAKWLKNPSRKGLS
ncbi:hypothetical protein, partial [Acetobacter persici]